jgi:hypothetical protein
LGETIASPSGLHSPSNGAAAPGTAAATAQATVQ